MIQEVIYDKSAGQKVPVKSWAKNLEPNARQQAIETASLPGVVSHVALMPDVHYCPGANVGSVVATKNIIVPEIVSNDIGCGMLCQPLNLKIDEIDINGLMEHLTKEIPVGIRNNTPDEINNKINRNIGIHKVANRFKEICETEKSLHEFAKYDQYIVAMCSEGGSNHFVALQKDDFNNAYIMIHSGSRNFGGQIGNKYAKLAVQQAIKYNTQLPNPKLAYLHLEDQVGQDYFNCMQAAVEFALLNRLAMLEIGMEFFGRLAHDYINVPHNYATKENHYGQNVIVHRKGATLAREGTIGIIPGSMCSHSYIVKGKGNKESFNSCSHGAGRLFSRKEANRRIASGVDKSVDEQIAASGIKIYGNVNCHDELGSAYKDIDEVMQNQTDLVDIVTRLKDVSVLKG